MALAVFEVDKAQVPGAIGNLKLLVDRDADVPVSGQSADAQVGKLGYGPPGTINMVDEDHRLPIERRLTKLEIEYDGSNNPIFFGEAAPGADFGDPVWRISKFEYDGANNFLRRLFADGNLAFDNVWADRAGLDYS